MTTAERWLAKTSSLRCSGPDLICLPHAGSGPAAYRGWQRRLGTAATVVPVTLPGHGARRAERLCTSIPDLARGITHAVLQRSGTTDRLVFGHSMGALVAYEVTRCLVAEGQPPRALIVSGSPAPHRLVHGEGYSNRPDAEFLSYIASLGGTPVEVLEKSGLLDLVLTVLRADFAAVESYEWREIGPLDVPIVALGGAEDPRVAAGELVHWADLTIGQSPVRIFEGGHFFLYDQIDEFLAEIRNLARF
ncbi:thioesterase II family protein [Streptomyces sp. NPDC020965]|uniref:thioesterase II family protein n=1 Tax=Streptomyces sp. NPDC020965 TaxID=3365105 RepID=UPI0037B1FA38